MHVNLSSTMKSLVLWVDGWFSMMTWMSLTLLLCSHCAVGASLSAPLNVSIRSLNMEHWLTWQPAPDMPADTRYKVDTLRLRKSRWNTVAGCKSLLSSQVCNVTMLFNELLEKYRGRVQAFTSNHTSNWTYSGLFEPLGDTVLGPPGVLVSGCGNCLLLQISPPIPVGHQSHQQLLTVYRGLTCLVRRTRDGAQFTLNLPYQEDTVIDYLQPEVEYCVTVTMTAILNHNSIPSPAICAFTSPPPTNQSVHVILSLLGVFCLLALLLMGLVIYGGQLISQQRLPKTLSAILLYSQLLHTAQSDQYIQPSDQYIQPSDQYIQPPDQYIQPPDQYIQPSDQYIQPPDQYIQHSDQYIQQSDQYIQPSDQYIQHSDQYIQQSDQLAVSDHLIQVSAVTLPPDDRSSAGPGQEVF